MDKVGRNKSKSFLSLPKREFAISDCLLIFDRAKENYREMAKVVSKGLDGKYALMSTRTTMSAKEIISAYYDKDKDGIEKAFCCIEQPIGLRPIRHWLDGRVKAHIFICYLSYLLNV